MRLAPQIISTKMRLALTAAADDPFAPPPPPAGGGGLGRGLLKPPVVLPSTPSTGVLKLLASSRPASMSLLVVFWLATVLDGPSFVVVAVVVAVDAPVADDSPVGAVPRVVAAVRWPPREARSMSGVWLRRAAACARRGFARPNQKRG